MHLPPLDTNLDSCPETVQGKGDDEEGEWRGGSLYAIGYRLADRALAGVSRGQVVIRHHPPITINWNRT